VSKASTAVSEHFLEPISALAAAAARLDYGEGGKASGLGHLHLISTAGLKPRFGGRAVSLSALAVSAKSTQQLTAEQAEHNARLDFLQSCFASVTVWELPDPTRSAQLYEDYKGSVAQLLRSVKQQMAHAEPTASSSSGCSAAELSKAAALRSMAALTADLNAGSAGLISVPCLLTRVHTELALQQLQPAVQAVQELDWQSLAHQALKQEARAAEDSEEAAAARLEADTVSSELESCGLEEQALLQQLEDQLGSAALSEPVLQEVHSCIGAARAAAELAAHAAFQLERAWAQAAAMPSPPKPAPLLLAAKGQAAHPSGRLASELSELQASLQRERTAREAAEARAAEAEAEMESLKETLAEAEQEQEVDCAQEEESSSEAESVCRPSRAPGGSPGSLSARGKKGSMTREQRTGLKQDETPSRRTRVGKELALSGCSGSSWEGQPAAASFRGSSGMSREQSSGRKRDGAPSLRTRRGRELAGK
jgi:hypothetical protein